MSNLTLSMALAQNAKKIAIPSDQQDSASTSTAPMAPMTPTNDKMHAEESDKDDIPEFSHILPAIFVPLKQDLLSPIEPAKDRVERLKRMQANLDANETAVRDNLSWMFEREARRRVAHAKKTRDLSEPHRPELIDWDEGEKLIASLTTPANPGQSYHVPSETLAEWHKLMVQPVAPGQMPPHEQTAREVLYVANNGPQQIENYSMHINTIREKMKKSLERADVV